MGKNMLSVLDLYSGLGGWSQAFLDHGHDVLRIDNDERFSSVPNTTISDVFTMHFFGQPDIILASPPCEKFSVGRISKNWIGSKNEPLRPRTDGARAATQLVFDTMVLISELNPRYWWMENPSGAMKRLDFLRDIPMVEVTYCQYGRHYRKPTNLWGKWPSTWKPHPSCQASSKIQTVWVDGVEYATVGDGIPCHESARRGAKTGVQGLKDSATRALIPYDLSLEVCVACEEAYL